MGDTHQHGIPDSGPRSPARANKVAGLARNRNVHDAELVPILCDRQGPRQYDVVYAHRWLARHPWVRHQLDQVFRPQSKAHRAAPYAPAAD